MNKEVIYRVRVYLRVVRSSFMQPSNAGPSNHAGPSSSTEMRQMNPDTVNPFTARPAIYYGDGPFDPPSSDDDDEEAEGRLHNSEDDAESGFLLNVDQSGYSSPGRAERGDQSLRRTDAIEKVRPFNGVHGGLLFSLWILANVLLTEVLLSPCSCSCAYFSGRPRHNYRHSCWLYIFWKIISYTRNAKDYYGPYFQWHILCIRGRSKLGTGRYVRRKN